MRFPATVLQSVPTWVQWWRVLNILLGGVLGGLAARVSWCRYKGRSKHSHIPDSIPLSILFLGLATAIGSLVNLRVGVSLSVAVPLYTIGEAMGIYGLWQLLEWKKRDVW